MALQENVAVRLAYKAYASGSMTSNSEPDTATDPGASGAQDLRRVSSTLSLGKDTYQSNEVRTDRQVSDFRHGIRRVTGEIGGELSPATYWDLMEAAMRGTAAAEFSKTEADFTSMAADSTTSKFTVGGSTWADEDFRVGDVIRFTDLSTAANNSKNFLIMALSGTDATVSPAPTTMSADTAFTVTRAGKKVVIPTTGHAKRKFAFEHYHQDIDVAELFTECRISRMALAMPATGLCTVAFGVMGRNKIVFESTNAPYFSDPTAANKNGITAAVNGAVMFQGERVGVITGIDFALDMATDAPAVVGQNFPPEVFLGRSVVTGNLTALFENADFLNAFADETEVEIMVMVTTTSADNSPFIAFTMPRVKLGGADVPLQGEAGLPITCPFQALLKPTTAGYDSTTLIIQDSEA